MKRWFKWFLSLLLALLLVELGLRFLLGFGHLPVYEASTKYEYALRPGQSLKRFGNVFSINEAGMRSAPLSGKSVAGQASSFRILKLGDSVLNGGLATDQDALASTMLEVELSAAFPERDIRVLNVSAGSWGPDNALAWVEQHGTFEANLIVLVFSSHDWRDCMEFKQVVGNVPFYPASQPKSAISDALSWAWSRVVSRVDWQALPQMEHAPRPQPCNVGPNPGWPGWKAHCTARELPLLVYHHPTQEEWEGGAFNEEGRALQNWLASNNIQVINGLDTPYGEDAWRDPIHPNALGQKRMAAAMRPVLVEMIQNMP